MGCCSGACPVSNRELTNEDLSDLLVMDSPCTKASPTAPEIVQTHIPCSYVNCLNCVP